MADEIKFSKQTVTNVTNGPKVLNSRSGHLLQAGETVEDVEISDAELDSMKAAGHFEFGKAAAARAAKETEAEAVAPEAEAAPAKSK